LLAIVSLAAPAQQAVDDDGAPTFTVSDLPAGRPLRIVVYGDMRFTDAGNTLNPIQECADGWRKGGRRKADILLLTAICLFTVATRTTGIVIARNRIVGKEQLRIYPTIGNHEGLTDPPADDELFAAYPQIDHHNWYSVRMGNIPISSR